jgi:hypothetical protein
MHGIAKNVIHVIAKKELKNNVRSVVFTFFSILFISNYSTVIKEGLLDLF